MFGLYLILGILGAALLLLGYAVLRPKLKRYKLILKRVEPKKRHARSKAKKKRKSVWIKVI
jgi:Flp pilus assembly protein TadB